MTSAENRINTKKMIGIIRTTNRTDDDGMGYLIKQSKSTHYF